MKNLFIQKLIFSSFLFFFLFFFIVKADISEKEEKIIDSTVNLMCVDETNNVSMTGTGLIIDPFGYVLTNRHVAENSTFCCVYYSQALGQEADKSFFDTAFLVESSNSYDLALLKINEYNKENYLDISIQSGKSQDYRDAFYYGYPSRQPGETEITYLLTKRIGPVLVPVVLVFFGKMDHI
jgi:S1-C subfamily serine protease